jgi:small subunit ribosomal protein S17
MSAKKITPEVVTEKKEVIVKKFNGVVISYKSDNTVVVNVESVKIHPKYKKRYVVSRHYKVHDEKNECKIGDKVVFIECRPLSRDKRWRIIK